MRIFHNWIISDTHTLSQISMFMIIIKEPLSWTNILTKEGSSSQNVSSPHKRRPNIHLCHRLSQHTHTSTPATQAASTVISIDLLIITIRSFVSWVPVLLAVRCSCEREHASGLFVEAMARSDRVQDGSRDKNDKIFLRKHQILKRIWKRAAKFHTSKFADT